MNTASREVFWSYDGGNYHQVDTPDLREWREQEVSQLAEVILHEIYSSPDHPYTYIRRQLKTSNFNKASRNLAQLVFGIRFASRLITDGEIDPEEIIKAIVFLNASQIKNIFQINPKFLHLAYVPENCPVDDLSGKIIVNLNYFCMLIRDENVEQFGGSYGEVDHEDAAFFGALEEFAHLVFDRERESGSQRLLEDFKIDNQRYPFSRDEEIDALVWKAITESLFGTNYGFASRLEEATSYHFDAINVEPEKNWDSGQRCLDFLGYDGYHLVPGEIMEPDHVRSIEGSLELVVDQLASHDYGYPHLLLIYGKKDLSDVKQWIIRHGELVYCPILGEMDAKLYLDEYVKEVESQFIIPLLEGPEIPEFYYELIVNFEGEYSSGTN